MSKTAWWATLALLATCLLARTSLCNSRELASRSSLPQRCSKHSYSQEQLQHQQQLTSTNDSSPPPSLSLSLSAAGQRKASLFYRDLCLFPYALVPGYISAQRSLAEAVRATSDTKILYYCNDSTTAFYFSHHLKNTLTQRAFDAQRLLGLLKGKTLTFLGDSTARQVFMDLQVELLPFLTKMVDFNTTHAIANPAIAHIAHAGMHYGRLRLFDTFNATLAYCQNSRLESVLTHEARFACNDRLSKGDFIVIAGGAWFRPYEVSSARDPPIHAEALALRLKAFTERIRSIRAEIAQLNPRAKVIWRLVPHVGAFDELFAAKDAGGIDPAKREMYKKNNWDRVSLVAKWVLVFNDAIRALVASEYPHDALWDVFTVSAKFIDFATQQPRPYKVHDDATHYCPGGAMRASLLLLEEIIGRGVNSM